MDSGDDLFSLLKILTLTLTGLVSLVTLFLTAYAVWNIITKRHVIIAKLTGKNPEAMPVAAIQSQTHELRPLPMGLTDFYTWSDRIIGGAMVTADVDDQRYVLANEILHLKPTEDHKDDAYFMHLLRKLAANQVADAFRREHYDKKKAAKSAEEAAAKAPN